MRTGLNGSGEMILAAYLLCIGGIGMADGVDREVSDWPELSVTIKPDRV